MTVPLERQKNTADVAARVRDQLGLGSAAIADASIFATAAQGAKADSAIQAADLAAYATKDEVEGAAAGNGDVSGPAVAIDNAPVGFSGTSGKSIKQLTGPVAALHAVTGAANKLAYFTGAAAMATTDLTAFARTLLDDADGAAMFATMGATFSGNATAGAAKLPSGLELKWGTSTNSRSDYRLLFPVAFANDCFVALPINTFDYGGLEDRFIGVSMSHVDKNGFDIRARNITNGGGVAGQPNVAVRWLAVGW